MSLDELLEKRKVTELSFSDAIIGIKIKTVGLNDGYCWQCDCDCNCKCDCEDW